MSIDRALRPTPGAAVPGAGAPRTSPPATSPPPTSPAQRLDGEPALVRDDGERELALVRDNGAREPALPLRPRADALPEHLHYRDEGCDLFASCLACPLPRCRYDVPGGVRTMLSGARDREIRRLREDEALPIEEIARRFGISRRTVFRALEPRRPRPARARVEPCDLPACEAGDGDAPARDEPARDERAHRGERS